MMTERMRCGAYDKAPVIDLPLVGEGWAVGWPAVGARLRDRMGRGPGELGFPERRSGASPVLEIRGSVPGKTVVVVECYPGVDEDEVVEQLGAQCGAVAIFRTREVLRREAEIDALCAPYLGGDDPVFGYRCGLTLSQFLDAGAIVEMAARVAAVPVGWVLVVGVGASAVVRGDILIYADLARWEIQQRQRRGRLGNLGASNAGLSPRLLYKRAFFVDWRVADRWKAPLLAEVDFFLDTHRRGEPRLAPGDDIREGLARATRRPFRLVPFFDPGVWGGQWMKEVCDLDRTAVNYAWCFDGVPEENSIVFRAGGIRFELPAQDLVLREPRRLLGDPVHARFGAEFPIRFDLLDTMGGGNLSLQVHPLTEYIQARFGMSYTQDESYYLLDAGVDASVYLGLVDGVDSRRMAEDLRRAQEGGVAFPVERHVRRWPARRHDHFSIPAGTVHCSGRNSLVLEISATPYLFTFKMWDWGRVDLNGRPRPIHLDHALANICWDRTESWVRRELMDRVVLVSAGDGWREERTGLHEREFIETRRLWFHKRAPLETGGMERGGVHVLNLVEGEEAVVESPDGSFEPFEVHFAETYIIPAAVGSYTIRPLNGVAGREMGVMRAYVRTGLEERY